jgi:signal transduction histidine kinase
MRAVRLDATIHTVTAAADRPPIEPLFASNARLWLRVWATTQAVGLAVACNSIIDAAGGVGAFFASPTAARSLSIVALLVIYHVAVVRGHAWMMRRPWAVIIFMPLGWALFVASVATSSAFSVLILGAILQGFIFMPFNWAIGALALVLLFMVSDILSMGARYDRNLTIARVVGVLSMGMLFGTVMLYIHRANRDSAIRSKLLRELDDAQRDLAARARDAGTQEERQRLARDIHDTLAQGFASVIKHLEAIELSFQASRDNGGDVMRAAWSHLANAQAVSRTSLAEIRRLVWALRPPQLVQTPLPAAIERIVTQWSEANGIAATCAITELPTLQPDADVIFLRATQESLSNVSRHAQATHVSVTMHCVDGLVLLSVEDDGRGFADADALAPGRMGITGIRERVRPVGGRVLVESEAGAGTSITVALPLASVAATP